MFKVKWLSRGMGAVAVLAAHSFSAEAGSPTQDGFRKLAASQLHDALVGREFSDDVHFRYRYQANGEIAGQEMGQRVRERWRIADDQLCATSRERETCYFVWKKGDVLRLTIDDSDIFIDGRLR